MSLMRIVSAAAPTPTRTPAPSPSPSSCTGGLIACPPQFDPVAWLRSGPVPGGWLTLLVVAVAALLMVAWRYRPAPHGQAGVWALWKRTSVWSMRWSSRQTRPSLGRARWWAPGPQVGTYLGRSRQPRRRLRASFEDSVLAIGLAGQGKDTWVGNVVVEAPGALLFASTKAEDVDVWIRHRATMGPVMLFNPDRLAALPSSLRFSPVSGCRDPEVAIQTAGYLLMGSAKLKGLAHEDFFSGAAAKVLRCLLIAAACSGRTLIDVYRWCCDEANTEPLELLEHANTAAEGRPYTGFLGDLRSVFTSRAGATSGSVYQTLSTMLQFMASPAVAATVDVPPDQGGFDVAAFLRAKGTLVLLGADKDTGTTAPLLTCLVGRLVEQAQIIASHLPKGRLDPPFFLVLNEAAKIIPLPVDRYFADHRGKGMPTIVLVQSRGHLVTRWGPDRGRVIYDTAQVKLLYGGSTDEDYLRSVELSAGSFTHREPAVESQSAGVFGNLSRTVPRDHVERRPVIPADRLRLLPKFQYVVLRSNLQPVIAKTRKVWRRRIVRKSTGQPWPHLCATVTPQMADLVQAEERRRRDATWPRRLARRVGIGPPGRDLTAGVSWQDPAK